MFVSVENKLEEKSVHQKGTHRGLCWFDFLEMLGNFFFAMKLSLALGTSVTRVVHGLGLLLGYRLTRRGCWGGLACKGR